MRNHHLFALAALSLSTSMVHAGFLLTTFRDETTPLSEQIYMAVSDDGKRWEALKNGQPVLVSDVGTRGVRDSFMIRAHDNSKTWIIATDLCVNGSGDWRHHTREGSRSIVVWESSDLVTWSPARLVEVAPPQAGCVWAPEAIYDAQTGDYLVYWASTDRGDDYRKQRIWAARTKDFRTFGKPFVYVEKPDAVIDLTIARDGERYVRLAKNEQNKSVDMDTAPALTGPWESVKAFTIGQGKNWEGPIAYRLKPAHDGQPAEWCVWLDNVSDRIGPGAFGYTPFVTTDLAGGKFTAATDFSFPFPLRHGSILEIDDVEMHRLKSAYAKPEITATPSTTAPSITASATTAPQRKSMVDYFLPMPVREKLSDKVWGAPVVGPRDPANGLEDRSMEKYCYWDGAIFHGADGKWHLFASRWPEKLGHNGWFDSVAVHAVADDVVGPYVDKGPCWPDNQGGKGHNVTALILPDGRYAITISETRPGEVFASKSPDGPWESLGKITVEGQPDWHASNVTPVLRPDGQFMIVQRSGQIMLAKNITGPYVIQGPSIYPPIKGMLQENLEDPIAWHSGGLYHIVVNSWGERKAFHLTSPNGVTDWTLRGLAYDPRLPFIRYADGTVNRWDKIERPGVIMKDGHVTHFTFAVLDVPKDDEKGNDRHGSKVIVVPFDGAALDRDLAGK